MNLSIEPESSDQTAVCAVIAHRMALTLMEAPRMSFADAMALLPSVRERLAFYLNPWGCAGRVWVARLGGESVGRTMALRIAAHLSLSAVWERLSSSLVCAATESPGPC